MEVMHENKYFLLSHARDPRLLTLRFKLPKLDPAPSSTSEHRSIEENRFNRIVRQQWIPLADARVGPDSFWLAVESIESPGNLGAIIRTAEAAGVSGILMLGSESDPMIPLL
jgi:tRNA G18 (ribose-2'-O)-methylase SpoU